MRKGKSRRGWAVFCLMMLLTGAAPAAMANGPSPDKGLHLSGSYILTNLMMEEGMSRTQAFFLTLAVGIVKESLDRNNSDTEHLQDLGANMLGATGGIVFFEYKPKKDPVW